MMTPGWDSMTVVPHAVIIRWPSLTGPIASSLNGHVILGKMGNAAEGGGKLLRSINSGGSWTEMTSYLVVSSGQPDARSNQRLTETECQSWLVIGPVFVSTKALTSPQYW